MRRILVVGAAVLIASAAACGKSAEQEQAEQIQKSAEDVQRGAEDLAKGLADMAKGLNAAAGGEGARAPVTPVAVKDLQSLLPELPGWERGKPTGERMTAPVTYAQAEVSFTKGDARIEAKIVDSAFNQLLIAPFAMFLNAGYERETSEGFERTTKIGDYPGWEKWNGESKSGELNAVVNNRFIVTLEGRRLDDDAVLRSVMGQTDLKKLAALK